MQRAEDEVVAMGDYCERLMRDDSFNSLCEEFALQNAAYILRAENVGCVLKRKLLAERVEAVITHQPFAVVAHRDHFVFSTLHVLLWKREGTRGPLPSSFVTRTVL